MSGFSNPIIGGGGSLVYPSIHSPGFQTGVTGWSIDKNGDAEFNDVVIRGTFFGVDFIISTAGIFLYSGPPALGNLAISIAPAATTTDPEGNAVQGGGMKIYGASGQAIFLGLVGSISQLIFSTGASFEKTAGNVAAGITGAGTSQAMELLISGPQGSHAGQQDWAQIVLVSGTNGSGAGALGSLLYVDTSGTPHAVLDWDSTGVQLTTLTASGTINGVPLAQGGDPGAESLTPGAAFGAPPTGTATQASSFAAGSPALSYLAAVETSYNLTRSALVDLIGRYNSLRTQLIASGVIA